MLAGDSAALRELMARYDRLVRYAIFRAARVQCTRDPEWLETVASDTWMGFVQSMKGEGANRPASLAAYLARVASNRTVSALRRIRPDALNPLAVGNGSSEGPIEPIDAIVSAEGWLQGLEELEALRGCMGELLPHDRTLLSHLGTITERRWTDAARALNLPESTLRSRWKDILESLRACLERKGVFESRPPG